MAGGGQALDRDCDGVADFVLPRSMKPADHQEAQRIRQGKCGNDVSIVDFGEANVAHRVLPQGLDNEVRDIVYDSGLCNHDALVCKENLEPPP